MNPMNKMMLGPLNEYLEESLSLMREIVQELKEVKELLRETEEK